MLYHRIKAEKIEDWKKLLDPNDSELKTTHLYLKVEATENVFTVVNKGVFLEDEPFKLGAAVSVYKIYQKGEIVKYNRKNHQ